MKINRFYIYVVCLLVTAIFFESVIDDKIRVGILMIIQLLLIVIKELITIADKKPTKLTVIIKGYDNNIEVGSNKETEVDNG
jgi:hypothetical protein